MERNENGYPTPHRDTDDRWQGGASTECCPGEDHTLGDKLLGYAYVPIQRWRMMYMPEDALMHGTMFEELYKPMEVYGNE